MDLNFERSFAVYASCGGGSNQISRGTRASCAAAGARKLPDDYHEAAAQCIHSDRSSFSLSFGSGRQDSNSPGITPTSQDSGNGNARQAVPYMDPPFRMIPFLLPFIDDGRLALY